jgi:hypothetical protein
MASAKRVVTNILDSAFSNTPHPFYLVYDELTDELIMRLVKPETAALTFDLDGNDSVAFLIEPETNEVVGFNLYNFQTEHLPHWNTLNKIWYKENIPGRLSRYKMFQYDPKKHERHHHMPPTTPSNLPKQFSKSMSILEEVVA